MVVNGIPETRGLRIMLDDGANVHLIAKDTCTRMGITYSPTNWSLTSCNQIGNSVLGMTDPVLLVYGVGRPDAIKEWHRFPVVDGMDGMYHVLLGNADTIKYGTIIDSGTQQYHLRPLYPQVADKSPLLSLPTTLASPDLRRSAGAGVASVDGCSQQPQPIGSYGAQLSTQTSRARRGNLLAYRSIRP